MTFQISPYSLAFLVTGLISGIATVFAWRKRQAPGGLPLFLMLLAVTEWNLAGLMEISSSRLAEKILWSKWMYLGAHTSPGLFVLFAFAYTGRKHWITRRNAALLYLVPAITILLAATNEWHHLIWTDFTPGPAGSNIYVYEHGIWFWVSTIYINSILFVGTWIMLRFALQSQEIYLYQTVGVIVAALFPWVAFFIYLSSFNPFPGLDLAAISFAFTGAILVFIILRWQFLDIIPVARETLIEEMADGVLVLDRQNRIVDINMAARRLFGVEAGHWIGQGADAVLIEWPDLLSCLDDYQSLGELTLHSPQVRHLDIRVSPLRQQAGELTGRLIILHDITEHKRAQEALRHYADQLGAQNVELDTFAHTVAHDLKGPLSMLIGYAELASDRRDSLGDAEQQRCLIDVVNIAYKMDNIISELLTLSEVRKADVKLQPLDMASLVAEAQRRLSQMIAESRAEITCPKVWPQALGYAPWVEEVWVNYLSNALKYGGHPPRIELGVDPVPLPLSGAEVDQGRGMIRFWVCDNGNGISPQDQVRLFTPFTRLDQVNLKGHGLGLSIVRRIVERLGGQVSVESEGASERGSVFSFTLPAADTAPGANRG